MLVLIEWYIKKTKVLMMLLLPHVNKIFIHEIASYMTSNKCSACVLYSFFVDEI